MASDALREKRQRFVNRYEALFGTWPGAKNPEVADEWFRLVDSVTLDKLGQLFDTVLREHGKRLGAPRAGLFWLAWKEIRPPKKQEEQAPREYCGLCEGTGRMWAIGKYEPADRSGRYVPVTSWDAKPPIYRYVVHCICPQGERYRHLATHAQQAEALAWRRDVLPGLIAQHGGYRTGTPEILGALDLLRLVNCVKAEKAPSGPPVASDAEAVSSVSGEPPNEHAPQTAAESASAGDEAPQKVLPGGYTEDEVPF